MARKGTLYLIPTPLNENYQLSVESKLLLSNASLDLSSLILIEDIKPARKRWIKWGFDRENINRFIRYSEHNQDKDASSIIAELISGKNAYLMSDGGLPAFCDPGEKLVGLCHDHKIKVSCGAFCNSPMLALIMSGFKSQPFSFIGFLPIEKQSRQEAILKLRSSKATTILMDTPYRLNRLLQELSLVNELKNRRSFLAIDLNMESEEYKRGPLINIAQKNWGKREFILILENIN